jgi:hypothetical protein
MVQKLASIYQKGVAGSVCRNIPEKKAHTQRSYMTHQTDDVNCGTSETERRQCFWMSMIIPRYSILAVNQEDVNYMQNNCPPNDG